MRVDKKQKTVYSVYIIQHTTHSNYSALNQRDLILDTAENLTQIGEWTRDCYQKELMRIELFLSLTRKNLNALIGFPLSPALSRDFAEFCRSFDKLEEEFHSGIVDKTLWAEGMLKWGSALTRTVDLI